METKNKNPFSEDLLKVINKKNYNGCLVSFLKDGKVMWNGREFENILALDKHLETIKFNVK